MLQSVALKFTEHTDVTLPAPGVNVIVGPNGSGKSLLLRELYTAIGRSESYDDTRILRDYEVTWPDNDAEIHSLIESFGTTQNTHYGEMVNFRGLAPYTSDDGQSMDKPTVLRMLAERSSKQWYASNLIRWRTLLLNGRTRFNLTNDQRAGNLQRPVSSFMLLFRNDNLRRTVRNYIYDAFGVYFVLDVTNLDQISVKFSAIPPPENERSLDESALEFYRQLAIHEAQACLVERLW